jgi:hypothetical protein
MRGGFHAAALKAARHLQQNIFDMNEKEKYWLAGILEGEAAFLKSPPSEPNSKVAIKVEMTDRDVVERVSELFGSYSIQEIERNRKKSWSDCYRVTVTGSRAIEIMKTVKPVLGKRRTKKIESIIDSYNPYAVQEAHSNYTAEEVKEVWKVINNSSKTLKEISEKLDVKYSFVKDLNRGKVWNKLTGI